MTTLHNVCFFHSPGGVELLVSHGADVNALTVETDQVLHSPLSFVAGSRDHFMAMGGDMARLSHKAWLTGRTLTTLCRDIYSCIVLLLRAGAALDGQAAGGARPNAWVVLLVAPRPRRPRRPGARRPAPGVTRDGAPGGPGARDRTLATAPRRAHERRRPHGRRDFPELGGGAGAGAPSSGKSRADGAGASDVDVRRRPAAPSVGGPRSRPARAAGRPRPAPRARVPRPRAARAPRAPAARGSRGSGACARPWRAWAARGRRGRGRGREACAGSSTRVEASSSSKIIPRGNKRSRSACAAARRRAAREAHGPPTFTSNVYGMYI